ncbi:hypothetical protein [Streptomyces sp. NPDC002491]
MKRLSLLAPLVALPLLLTACDVDDPGQPSCVEIDVDHHKPRTSKPRTYKPKSPAYKAPRPARRR